MAKRFRCPVCGSFGWSSAFDKNYDIECYRQVSLGKAHGFRFEKVYDSDLVARVKTKIRILYMKFFLTVSIRPDSHIFSLPATSVHLNPILKVQVRR